MDYRALIFGAVLAFSGVAQAGYAQLATPERFSGGPGTFTFAPSANDARYGKVAFQPGALRVPVPGVPTTMPAAYRFAANAPRFAAAAVFLHPGVRAAVGIAAWLGAANIIWDEVDKNWKIDNSPLSNPINTFEYHSNYDIGANKDKWFPSYTAACNSYVDALRQLNTEYINITLSTETICNVTIKTVGVAYPSTTGVQVIKRSVSCPAGWYVTPAGCVQTQPMKTLTEPEFVDKLVPKPMPDTVPWELPFPTPLPVDPPFINPRPSPDPEHLPKFVPTGDPLPNPTYDPNAAPGPANQPWTQPGVNVKPRPTTDQPFRVDLEPVNRPQAGPEPLPDTEPDPDNPDKPKPEEQQSLCEKHPEILACQVIKDSGEKPELKTQAAEFEFTPESGFGGAAACPAPIVVNASGMNLSFSWQPFCDSLGLAKPIILAFAWLSAAFIMLGSRQT